MFTLAWPVIPLMVTGNRTELYKYKQAVQVLIDSFARRTKADERFPDGNSIFRIFIQIVQLSTYLPTSYGIPLNLLSISTTNSLFKSISI